MEGVKIRLAEERDLRAISTIYNYYVERSTCTWEEETESPQERAEWFREHGPEYPVTVVEVDGEVVAWGALSPYRSRSGYRQTVEGSIYVHQEFHRRGIGRAILTDLVQRARDAGHHTIIAAVSADQTASIGLVEAFGFAQVGRLREVGLKFGRRLDVVYLQLML
jgi:L-amino acid N-acyltransferase YncA